MKRYESLSDRAILEKELADLKIRIKNSPFVDPMDISREKEILSLLLSGGESKDYKLKSGKFKKSKRVTPFNKYRT